MISGQSDMFFFFTALRIATDLIWNIKHWFYTSVFFFPDVVLWLETYVKLNVGLSDMVGL
jgi:hypothetical protein